MAAPSSNWEAAMGPRSHRWSFQSRRKYRYVAQVPDPSSPKQSPSQFDRIRIRKLLGTFAGHRTNPSTSPFKVVPRDITKKITPANTTPRPANPHTQRKGRNSMEPEEIHI